MGSRDAWRHALQSNVNTWMVLELHPPLSLLLASSSCPPRSLALRSLVPHVLLVPLIIASPIHFALAAEPLRITANWHGRNLGKKLTHSTIQSSSTTDGGGTSMRSMRQHAIVMPMAPTDIALPVAAST
eukprot:9487182-Pyramimonas_sp.AAC.1